MDIGTAFFLGTFFVTSLMVVLALNGIRRHLEQIRDDLREHFNSEGRRWSIDQERRYEE